MKRIQLSETKLVNLIHRVINEKYTPSYCCVPDCSLCSVHCSGAPCEWTGPISGMSVSDRSDFMDEPHIGGTELANCRCPGNVLPGEYCDLNEICRAEAGGCFCREQDRAQY